MLYYAKIYFKILLQNRIHCKKKRKQNKTQIPPKHSDRDLCLSLLTNHLNTTLFYTGI